MMRLVAKMPKGPGEVTYIFTGLTIVVEANDLSQLGQLMQFLKTNNIAVQIIRGKLLISIPKNQTFIKWENYKPDFSSMEDWAIEEEIFKFFYDVASAMKMQVIEGKSGLVQE